MKVDFIYRKNTYLKIFSIFLFFLLILQFIRMVSLSNLQKKQVHAYTDQYESLELMTDLKNSSDDLTNMVRLYCLTKDPKYKDYYYEILDIRNGKIPRPLNYSDVYWDLKIADLTPSGDGATASLKSMMLERDFTLKEYSLLQESENRSNDLVLLEVRAINAMQGKFIDTEGNFTIVGAPDPALAQSLVFGKAYMDAKASIMEPIYQFELDVRQRTKVKTESIQKRMNRVVLWGVILSSTLIVLMIYLTFLVMQFIKNKNYENEHLLLNILPPSIAERLKSGEEKITDEYPQASVLFTDIVGFTEKTEEIGPSNMVEILNEIFDIYDELCEEFKVEKVKTIGDSYMAVCGVPIPRADHAIVLADFSLALKEATEQYAKRKNLPISIRIGMTFGKVFAGIIGRKKFIYDIWGDVVNTASRMESTGIPGEIQVTDKMASILEEQFILSAREPIQVKGKGIMHTYILKSRKPEFPLGKIMEIKENNKK
ncbi:MAG: adenylate/guanylate cyclase domain-containing protein [Chlamydiae bacterium]|nr:adenylate/guanylate cyclase domain-containing protein [Chlamydiota bacterium]